MTITQTTLVETEEDLLIALGEPDVFHTPGWTEHSSEELIAEEDRG